jgi:hypothetical protein
MNQPRLSQSDAPVKLVPRKFFRRLVVFIGALVATYILIYLVLSFNGQYQPSAVGSTGVKEYAWSPLGYYDANHPWEGSIAALHSKTNVYGGWNNGFLWNLFYPLYRIDTTFFHKPK